MKTTYIALVLVIAYLDGQRVEIPAGERLPEGLHQHDIDELLRLRSIEDEAAVAAAKKEAAKEDKAALADFEAARASVKAAAESIEVAVTPAPEGGTGEQDTKGDAGAAGGAGKADLKAPAAPKRQAAATKKKEV
ncbi:hypothetical protein [Azonexus fungiphilus]|uniref:hypothetical protein n=1 Tax=Azonexus fungiphilus TaxID=146940 RepID=UPI00156AF599|nr:hypothetical protein [Azonexus fungiphilus]NHC05931.1 hypothetical protein [Azonexus fungiphilus]